MPVNTFDFSFQQIVDAANDVIIVTKADPIDPPGPEIVYVNKAFTELTGYDEHADRFNEAQGKRRMMGKQQYPTDGLFMDAVRAGIPECRYIARTTVAFAQRHPVGG